MESELCGCSTQGTLLTCLISMCTIVWLGLVVSHVQHPKTAKKSTNVYDLCDLGCKKYN